jgi:response regulator RpfG family c-di-GMP phosphodiesterase
MSSKAKILYVDDEHLNLQLFEINFSKKYEVYIASTGFEGLDLLDKHPDILVIVSDMKMPEMNGIEFVTKARAKFPTKKYYILTGFEISPEIQAALDSGLILKYFKKPLNVKEIHSVIDEAIQ